MKKFNSETKTTEEMDIEQMFANIGEYEFNLEKEIDEIEFASEFVNKMNWNY